MNIKCTIPYILTGMTILVTPGRANNDAPSQTRGAATAITHTNLMPTTTPRVIAAAEHKYDVVYICDNGTKIHRTGGTRAWRNNNPGCIRYSDFMRELGAIGTAGGFAVFPDEETGARAISALLRGNKYKDLTISAAIFKYAPPHENNTKRYQNNLRNMTGLPLDLKIRDLTDEQMERVVRAIRTLEGWKTGNEVHQETPNPAIAMRTLIFDTIKARTI